MSYAASIQQLITSLEETTGTLLGLQQMYESNVRDMFATTVGDTADAPQALQDAHVLIAEGIDQGFSDMVAQIQQAVNLMSEYAGGLGAGIG